MVEKKNILVTGGLGQLGSALNKISSKYNYNFFFTNSNDLDIKDHKLVKRFIIKNNIQIIINCAAYTDVNNAENERELADKINHLAVNNLAKICKINNIKLIHVSTDYVFDGKKKLAYTEEDKTNPLNFYGLSKLLGEKKILDHKLSNSIIIRTSWLYSYNKNNFVSKIINKLREDSKINVVVDEVGSPTNSIDLATAIFRIIPKIKNSKTEIYNYSNIGFCSRFEFALKINSLLNKKIKINKLNTSQGKIKRPKFSVLNNDKIVKDFDIDLKSWEESLEDYVKQIKF